MNKKWFRLVAMAILTAFTVEVRAPDLPVVREIEPSLYQGC